MKRRRIVRAGLALAACLMVAGLWLARQARIDTCLDRGGRWDHMRNTCEEDPDRDAKLACTEGGGTWDFGARRCEGGR